MSLTPNNRNNPCQICEDTSGKCRQGREDLSYWQCMSYADSQKGEIVNGFKCIGRTRDQLWAQFRLDNSQEWNEQQRLEWQRENQRRRNQKAREDEQRRRRSLAATERHEQYTRLLAELTLHPDDRADLVRRGFTHEQIELSGFKSIGRYQQLQSQYSELLPGMASSSRLVIREEGYLCPIRNADGLIVACQVRLRVLQRAEDNRYRWLSGNGQTLHLYPEGGESEGELPLAIHLPQKLSKFAIGICEGVGAKPFLASQRLGIPFIGAAGGQHAGSPKLFKSSLQQIEEVLWQIAQENGLSSTSKPRPRNQKELHSSVNKGKQSKTEQRYQPQSSSIGTEPADSATKSQSSYLTSNSSQWLKRKLSNSLATTQNSTGSKCNPSEILSYQLAESQSQFQIELIVTPDAGDILNPSVMNRWQRVIALLEEWGWSVRVAWWNQTDKSYPDIDELDNITKIEFINPSDFLKPQQKGFDPESEPEWKVKAKADWRRNRKFNSDIKEATQWCSFSRPGANTIAFYKAGLGRGKTTRLRAWVEEWKQLEDVSFLCLGYRNTLLLQLCGEKDKEGKKGKGLGFYHLHEHSGMAMKSATGEGIALCVDSLWRFSPEDFDDKIIILDEVKSVIKHLLHSSTVKNRDKIISLFSEAIKRARQVICLDGLMADWVVDYLRALAPEKQIIRAENTYLGEKPRVNFLLGTAGIDKKIKVNDRSPWLKYLLEDSPMPAVCSDSQVMIEALDELLSAKGLKVLRVDSKTVPEQYVKDFLLNCDAYIEQHRPDVLLYTPSAESGVDVSIPNHFTHHFAFFFGVLDIDGILQMIGRIRDNITKFVWCKSFVADDEKQHSSSPFTETIAKSINEILIGDITSSLDDNWLDKVGNHLKTVIANSLDQNFRTSCIIKSVQNFEKSNLRECLKEVLIESGYKVVDCTLETHEESGKKAKEATEQVKRQNCSDIFNAEKVAPELVDELKFDATWEERAKVTQAKLRERLPGIEETSAWTEDFIYLVRYDDRNFINNLENYWLFTHPEVAKRQSQENLHWMARRLHTFVGNVRSRWARIHALLEMGFDRFLDPEKEWSNDSPELLTLVELGKKYSNPLSKHPGKSTPVQFLGNLLGLFGLRMKSRKDAEGKRWYRLDQEVINDPIRQQVLTCIETKLTQPKEAIDWEAAINEAHGVQTDNPPQTQSEQALEGTAPSPQFLYTNQLEGAVENLESQQEGNLVDQLATALAFCESLDDVAAVTEGEQKEVVESAIALTDSLPRRSRLRAWWEQLAQSSESSGAGLAHDEETVEPALREIKPGCLVRIKDKLLGDRPSLSAGLRGIVEEVRALGRMVVRVPELGDRKEPFASCEIELIAEGFA